MQRKSVLAVLAFMTVVSGAWYALITTYAWTATRPIFASLETGTVLGAATQISEVSFRPYPIITAGAPSASASSRRYVVYHPASGRVLAGKGETDSVPVASTTKLMAATVIVKYVQPDEVLTVPADALVGGSVMNLRVGEKITADSLLKGGLLVSGNDAINTLAIHVGKKLLQKQDASSTEARQRFIDEMNSTADQLGLAVTHFQDPAGLNDEGRSSAVDLAKIASNLLSNQYILSITTIPQVTVSSVDGSITHELKNSNRLVSEMNYPSPQIGKTGFTPDAGHCLVASSTQNGMTIVTVVLSTYSESKEASALESKKLLDWAFQNVTEITPVLPGSK